MWTKQRLTEVFNGAEEIPFNDSDKFILFSDCHRGDNSWADEFTHNHNLFLHALQDYFRKGFTYIEVGDGDELWENVRFEDIRQAHRDIFAQMQEFHQKKRLYLIWGNHDIERQEEKIVKKTLFQYYDRYTKKYKSLLEGIKVHEGLTLMGKNNKIFIVHGHQGDLWNDFLWPLNKCFHRMLWRRIQFFGIRNPASPAKYFKRAKKIDEKLKKWAAETNRRMPIALIAGHTHSYSLVDPPYFNIGSCLYPHCITGIEIVNSQISLIEWSIKVKEKDGTVKEKDGTLHGGTLYADRDVISQSYPV